MSLGKKSELDAKRFHFERSVKICLDLDWDEIAGSYIDHETELVFIGFCQAIQVFKIDYPVWEIRLGESPCVIEDSELSVPWYKKKLDFLKRIGIIRKIKNLF